MTLPEGPVLGVWAHPDDEAYLSAGLMATASEAGRRVVVATASWGERGTDDPRRWPPHRLAARRRGELARSLAAVGVQQGGQNLPDLENGRQETPEKSLSIV